MIRSIRFSLTLWYASILTAILCVFGVVLFGNVKVNLFRDIDAVLAAQAEGVADAIFSFWKAESETLPLKERTLKQFHDDVAADRLPDLVRRWAEVTDELDTVRPVRILSCAGETLAYSPSLSQWIIPVNSATLVAAGKGRMFFETYQVVNARRVRIVTRPVIEEGKTLYFVQVVTSLHQADASLDRLRTWLFWLIPTTVFVTSLIGWFLASLVLRPIGKMTRQAHELSESRLHRRIDVPVTGDELEALALTFNQMLDRFERGFKRLRQFSAAASHELRTPLTVMKGEMELALRKPRTEEEYERVLRNQLSVVNDMAHVVEQLLAVAHAEDGELAAQWETLSLGALVRSVVGTYEVMARQKNIAVRVVVNETVLVKGEKRLLERLIANLLENALKHTPPEGQVVFEIRQQEGQTVLVINDTGKGISKEDMPKIFEKFFSHKISAEGIASTGIGLGLCRWIVEVHKGRIEVLNSPGQGAEFRVFFPSPAL
ncbi:MAG TPA: ATP-binding protein [Candidatus Omnitrophota bacterium]|nr:ATP-binding protein [Candidatus Omnitrophota bacterium]HPS36681.1 ATP-binding protein [Candidatus Omnitrophota bacterium]